MISWPARCERCGNEVDDWTAAGLYDRSFMHKRCWTELYGEGQTRGRYVPPLRSPMERISQLEAPMFIFLMMFHFGLAAAVGGWFLLTQTNENTTTGFVVLVIGIIVPVIGAAGAALNILSRRHIESIRHELDLAGGWKPGR